MDGFPHLFLFRNLVNPLMIEIKGIDDESVSE
jgi:hypothetical protein